MHETAPPAWNAAQNLAFPSQRGSAAANAISQFIQAVVLFIYICVMGLHKATWPGGWGFTAAARIVKHCLV